MTTDRLGEIKARRAAATPGPWAFDGYRAVIAPAKTAAEEAFWAERDDDGHSYEHTAGVTCVGCGPRWLDVDDPTTRMWDCARAPEALDIDPTVATVRASYGDTATGQRRADAEFIAHAPDDIDWLIGEVARLGERVQHLLGEQAAGIKLMHERDRLAAELAWTQAGIARISEAWTEAVQREQRTANAHAYDLQQVRAERDVAVAALESVGRLALADRDRLAAELAVAKAALESGDACGAVGCRAVVERDRLAAQVRAVEQWAMVNEIAEPPLDWAGLRAALASAVTPEPTTQGKRDRCDGCSEPNRCGCKRGATTRSVASLLREVAARDPETHRAALARGYGFEPEPERCNAVGHPTVTPESLIPCMLVKGHERQHWSTTGCEGGIVSWDQVATPESEGPLDTPGGREYLRQLLGHHPSPGIVAAVRRTLAEEGTTLEEVAAEFGIDLDEPEAEK